MSEDTSTPHVPRLALKIAEELARNLEHQRLATLVKQLPSEAWRSWAVVIIMARHMWDKGKERPYGDYLRHHAYLEAADAIARDLLGEA